MGADPTPRYRYVVDMKRGGTIHLDLRFPICGEVVEWAPGHTAPCTRLPDHDIGHRMDALAFLADTERDGDGWKREAQGGG